jgi:hypothetical protein
MASPALAAWRTTRRTRLDRLVSAHAAVRAGGLSAVHLNRLLVLALAAEFQGFARDLHDNAADAFAASVEREDAEVARLVRVSLINERLLNRGNAHPGALGVDFKRLGLELWPALEAADQRARRWNRDLTTLNHARNAIAHADDAGLARLRRAGYPLTLAALRRSRNMLDALATTMDAVTSDYLAGLFSTPRPWQEAP